MSKMMGTGGRRRVCQLPRRWIVVGASFLVYTVLYGILYSYNVLFIAFKEEFNGSVTITGWVGSISVGLSLLVAPVVNVLLERFSCRGVAIVGVVTGASAIIVTSFLTHLMAVLVVYGVVFGFAGGVLTICAYDVVLLHFPEDSNVRSIAIILIGTSLGMLSFTPFMSFIISEYGWRILLRILGPLLFCVGLPCVLTFIEPSKTSHRCHGDGKKMDNGLRDEELSKQSCADVVKVLLNDPQKNFLSAENQTESQSFRCVDGSHVAHEAMQVINEGKMYHQINNLNWKAHRGDNGRVVDPTESGKHCLKGEMRCDDTKGLMNSKPGQSMTRKILKCLTFPELWLISISTLFNGIGDCFYLVNLINYMISVGFPMETGVTVVSIMGLSNLVGKILISLAGEYIPFPTIFLLVISPVVSVGVMFVIMFTRSQVVMYCVAVVVGGIMMTTTMTFTFSLPMDFFGPLRALETSAVVLFVYGLGYLLGSLVGESIDNTGSYTSAIWAFIGMYTTSGLCILMAPLYQRFFAPQRFITFDLHRKKREARKKGLIVSKSTVCDSDFKSTLIVCEQVTTV